MKKRAVSIDERARQGCDLARKQGRELEQLRARQAAELELVKARQGAQVRELQRQHVRQTVDLWVEQGRTLGPWTAPVLAGEGARGHEMPTDSGEGRAGS
jgi:hypothetical protein